jgi:GNAT superfamily N-acetyltransferase
MKKLILNKETFKGHGSSVSDHFIRLDRHSNVDRFFYFRTKDVISEWVDSFHSTELFDHFWILFEDKGKVIGVGQLTLTNDGEAEIAISVDDNKQNNGLGKKIMKELIFLASERGIKVLDVSYLASNKRMASIISGYNFKLTFSGEEVYGKLILDDALNDEGEEDEKEEEETICDQ